MSAENVKWRVNMAVRRSNLPSAARLIMLVLSDMADAKTGVIPERHSPSLVELAHDTDLGESTVKTQLAALEQLGWVVRTRPDSHQAARHISTGYRIQVGQAGEKREPLKRKPRARSKPPQEGTEGQEQAPAEGQEMAPETESGGQEQAHRGPGANPSGARSKPPYIKDDDLYDQDDLSATADAATSKGSGALFDAPPPRPRTETDKQRAYRLAAGYTKRVQLSNKDAVAKVVHMAVLVANGNGNRLYTDEQIAAALDQLVEEKRSVTADSLRIALEGPPRHTQQAGRIPHQTYRDPDPAGYYDPKAGRP